MYKLADDFVTGHAESESLREAFGKSLVAAAKQDDRIVALSADLAQSVGFGDFRDQMGDRFIEVGVAEQNLVGVASGLAAMGKIPFAGSYAAFSPGRNWEQIRTMVCLNDQPVKIVSSHTGLNVGADGATHQMLEDIALMTALPNMVVLAPGDALEAAKFAKLMAEDGQPNYIRLPRASLPVYSTIDDDLEIGKAYLVRQDDDAIVTIVSTGSMTSSALYASGKLMISGIPCEVVHVPTIKPLDKGTILDSVSRTKVTVTVEEHQVTGGLGSIVASTILESDARPQKFKRLGVYDSFGESGSAVELWHKYQLDVEGIVNQIKRLLDS